MVSKVRVVRAFLGITAAFLVGSGDATGADVYLAGFGGTDGNSHLVHIPAFPSSLGQPTALHFQCHYSGTTTTRFFNPTGVGQNLSIVAGGQVLVWPEGGSTLFNVGDFDPYPFGLGTTTGTGDVCIDLGGISFTVPVFGSGTQTNSAFNTAAPWDAWVNGAVGTSSVWYMNGLSLWPFPYCHTSVFTYSFELRQEFTPVTGTAWAPPPGFSNLGQSLAGATGAPFLSAAGELQASSPLFMVVTGAPDSATGYLVAGVSAVTMPLFGGTLVPDPLIVVPVPFNADGEFTLNAPWPAGLPAGSKLYLQFWVHDATAPHKFSASNALAIGP